MARITPKVDPEHFYFDGFRETFLADFTAPGDAAALRRSGALIAAMVVEYRQYWPEGEKYPRGELRAALADLRYLEGYLGHYLGTHHPFAADLGQGVQEIANRLEGALRTRRRF
jgi:hypothetical protein